MSMKRRAFMKAVAVAGTGAVAADSAGALTIPDPPLPAQLRLSCQEGRLPHKSLDEKLDFLEKHGFTGMEPGGRDLPDRVDEFKKALAGRPVKLSAICAGFEGVIVSPDEAERRKAVASMKRIMTAAGEIGSTGLIIVPAFNSQPQLPHKEAREVLVDLLSELGAHGVAVNAPILLEPLNRREAYFLRQVADAAAICRDVDSPGVCSMGDFWHMTWEETSDMGAFISAGPTLHHVHIASRKTRKMPGEDDGDNYVGGFRGLKVIGYRDYISLECGTDGDPLQTIPAAGALITRQWDQA